MTPAERLRKHQRALDRTQRELDRERTKLENQEKKLVQDIKKSAKNGQMEACKIQAKDLVRTRRCGVGDPLWRWTGLTFLCYQTIVMSPCVDFSPDRKPLKSNAYNRCFPGFTGRFLITQENEPLLNEMQACKVACQLLEAIAYMAEMNMYHGDISVNNYVVDQDLNVSPPLLSRGSRKC